MKLIHVILLNYYLNVLFSFIYDIKSILIIAGICVTIYFINKVFFPEDDDNKKKKKDDNKKDDGDDNDNDNDGDDNGPSVKIEPLNGEENGEENNDNDNNGDDKSNDKNKFNYLIPNIEKDFNYFKKNENILNIPENIYYFIKNFENKIEDIKFLLNFINKIINILWRKLLIYKKIITIFIITYYNLFYNYYNTMFKTIFFLLGKKYYIDFTAFYLE